MTRNELHSESVVTFEQKWLCVILIDVSASMSEDSLKKLNKELQDLHQSLLEDPLRQKTELCIITFGQGFQILQEPTLTENFTIPMVVVDETEVLANAVYNAVDKVEDRKNWYKLTRQPYYEPCIVLVTNEIKDWLYYSDAFVQVRKDVSLVRYSFLNVGMNGSSLLARKWNVLANLKDERSLFQMLSSHFQYYCCHDDMLDAPMCDYREDDVIDDFYTF